MFKRLSSFFWIALGMLCICLLIGKFIHRYRTDHISKGNLARSTAVVFNKKNYVPNHPVKAPVTLSYFFTINEKRYEGNSQDTSARVGDTVVIEYDKTNPDLNRPVKYNE